MNRPGTLKTVPIDAIKFTPFNPEARRENVAKLKDSIEKNGQLTAVQGVEFPNGTIVLADGNRTTEAMKQLGKDQIKVVAYKPAIGQDPMDLVKELFEELNEPKMTLKNGQMLNAALSGGPSFNTNVTSALNFLKDNFSEMELDLLRRQGVTPTAVSIAKSAARYCLAGIGNDNHTFKLRVRKTLFWLLRRGTQQDTKLYMQKGYDRGALARAIDRDSTYVPRMGKGQ
jgi:hypothetical protein